MNNKQETSLVYAKTKINRWLIYRSTFFLDKFILIYIVSEYFNTFIIDIFQNKFRLNLYLLRSRKASLHQTNELWIIETIIFSEDIHSINQSRKCKFTRFPKSSSPFPLFRYKRIHPYLWSREIFEARRIFDKFDQETWNKIDTTQEDNNLFRSAWRSGKILTRARTSKDFFPSRDLESREGRERVVGKIKLKTSSPEDWIILGQAILFCIILDVSPRGNKADKEEERKAEWRNGLKHPKIVEVVTEAYRKKALLQNLFSLCFFSYFSYLSFSLFRREEDSSKLKRRFVLFIRIPTVEPTWKLSRQRMKRASLISFTVKLFNVARRDEPTMVDCSSSEINWLLEAITCPHSSRVVSAILSRESHLNLRVNGPK